MDKGEMSWADICFVLVKLCAFFFGVWDRVCAGFGCVELSHLASRERSPSRMVPLSDGQELSQNWG
jgi:hypothetical protein